jgi:hypothetical protein
MKGILAGLFRRRSPTKSREKLKVTEAGLRYLNSPKYEKDMGVLVSRYFEPDESFYEFLVGVTAGCLSGSDPYNEELSAFEEFISNNIYVIRSAIDRIKAFRPQVEIAEKMWEHTASTGGKNERRR